MTGSNISKNFFLGGPYYRTLNAKNWPSKYWFLEPSKNFIETNQNRKWKT